MELIEINKNYQFWKCVLSQFTLLWYKSSNTKLTNIFIIINYIKNLEIYGQYIRIGWILPYWVYFRYMDMEYHTLTSFYSRDYWSIQFVEYYYKFTTLKRDLFSDWKWNYYNLLWLYYTKKLFFFYMVNKYNYVYINKMPTLEYFSHKEMSLIEYKLLEQNTLGIAYNYIPGERVFSTSVHRITNPVFIKQLRLDLLEDSGFILLPKYYYTKEFYNYSHQTTWFYNWNNSSKFKQWDPKAPIEYMYFTMNYDEFRGIMIHTNFVMGEGGDLFPNEFIFSNEDLLFNLRHLYYYYYINIYRNSFLHTINFYKWKAFLANLDVSENSLSYFNLLNMPKTNYFFPSFLPKKKKNILINKYQQNRFRGIYWTVGMYLNYFLNRFYNKEIMFNIDRRYKAYIDNKVEEIIFNKCKKVRNPSDKPYFLNEYIKILFMTSITKDVSFLYSWLNKNLVNLSFKKHFQFLTFIRITMFDSFQLLKNQYFIKGYKIEIKGKLAKMGSVRKKKFIIKQGQFSLSNAYLQVDEMVGYITTETGTIGIKTLIAF